MTRSPQEDPIAADEHTAGQDERGDMDADSLTTAATATVGKFGAPVAENGSKKDRTRAALMEAAMRTFAKNGIAHSSILEVTREADLSNGAFYSYFRNKQELVHSVGELLIVHVLDDLHSVIDVIAEPIDKVAIGIQWVIDKAASDPELGSLMAQSMVIDGPYSLELHSRFRTDVRAGIERGQFSVDTVDLVCVMIAAVDAAAILQVLGGADLDEVDRVTAEQHLRMLGVERVHASRLAVDAQRRLRAGELG